MVSVFIWIPLHGGWEASFSRYAERGKQGQWRDTMGFVPILSEENFFSAP
jgi:hypothetical protein